MSRSNVVSNSDVLAHALLASITDVAVAFDTAWRYTYVNDAATVFTGYAREALIGRVCWELFPELRGHENARGLLITMAERQPMVSEAPSARTGVWYQWRSYPMPDGGVAAIVQNIDERVRAEHALRESEQRFRALANLVPAVIWMTDRDGNPAWSNQRWHEYSGRTSHAQSFADLKSVMHPDEFAWVSASRAEALREGRSMQLEHRLKSRHGEYRWFKAEFAPIADLRGEIEHWVGVATDIQDQRDALNAEKGSREDAEHTRDHFSRVIAQLPLALLVLRGPGHTVEVVNVLARALFPKLRVGMSARELVRGSAVQNVDVLDHVIRTGCSVDVPQVCIELRDGTSAVYEVKLHALKDASEVAYGVVVVGVDVTAQVRAREEAEAAQVQALRSREEAERRREELAHALSEAEQARERLRAIVTAIPTAIAVSRGEDLVYELVNPAYLELVGGRDVEGKKLLDVFPEVAEESMKTLRDAYRTGEPKRRPEARVVYDRYGTGVMYEGYFMSYTAPLRSPDGTTEAIVTSTLEVTEQVKQREHVQFLRAEAELARTALERAHQELEARIAARTHELAEANAALAAENAANAQAEITRRDLLRRLASAREDEQRRTARDLHDQVGQTLSALMLTVKTACDEQAQPSASAARLRDALRLAQDLGRDVHELATRLRPSTLDDLGLQAALRQLFNDWHSRTNILVDFQATWLERERLPAETETVLFRVVQEAMTNIARHAQAHRVSVVVERHDGNAIAVVEDDGIGFELARAGAGRLGIVGMRERVMLAGGTLEIETEPGRGTTIIARVPVP